MKREKLKHPLVVLPKETKMLARAEGLEETRVRILLLPIDME